MTAIAPSGPAILSARPPSPAEPRPAGPSAEQYDVDPGQIRSLAAGLRRVRATLQGLGRIDATDPAALGSTLVAGGLHELSRSWSEARTRLGHELDLLARAGEVAAQAYATVDGNVLAAVGASVAPTAPAVTRQPGR